MSKMKNFKGYFFILPSLIGFMFFYVFPFVGGIKYSFSESGFDNTFVGFKNYVEILNNEAFRLALFNTGIFMVIAIPLVIIISLILALIIFETKANKFIIFFIIIPIAIPSAAVAGFFRKVFGTGFNNLLDSEYAMVAVILIFIWKNTGYNLIIYLASLTQIDKSLLESAEIDGANYLKKLRHIIIPLLTPATVFVGIITIINSFKVFRDVYILQGSYPNPNIYMLQHFMNNKFRDLQYEKLTSAAYMFAIVIFIFAYIIFFIDKRHSKRIGEN